MHGIELTKTPPAEVVYPDSDGQPMAETGVHVLAILYLIGTLKQLFRARDDVYVTGDMFLYYEEGKPKSRKAPDVMVVKGVPSAPERRSFKVWVEKAVPCFILEATSKETANEDQGAKRLLYQRLGVREYFLFDPLHEYLERQLMGYRLIDGEYEPLTPDNGGGLVSEELGVRLVPEEAQLGVFRLDTGERVPTPPQAYRLLEETEQRAKWEQRRANKAERRTKELERELERLRALLPPSSGDKSPRNGGNGAT
jgi:Uma2 family endonuclease